MVPRTECWAQCLVHSVTADCTYQLHALLWCAAELIFSAGRNTEGVAYTKRERQGRVGTKPEQQVYCLQRHSLASTSEHSKGGGVLAIQKSA